MRSIVWLASYPKSGNTWVRVFLTNYLGTNSGPADINQLESGSGASAREIFDELTGVESSDLTLDEIDRLRPAVFRMLAARSTAPLFLKTHDAWTRTGTGEPVVGGPEVTRATLYLIRNPLDVAVSLAHHSGSSVDQAIGEMANEHSAFAGRAGHLSRQLRQRLLTWSGHVCSWVEESGLPVRVVRYEDLIRDPVETFTAIVSHLELGLDLERVRRAVQFSSFGVLKAQEEATPFREKPSRAERFFRSGVAGAWREQLSPIQVDRIVASHGRVMGQYGYLSELEPGEPASEPAPPETGSVPTTH